MRSGIKWRLAIVVGVTVWTLWVTVPQFLPHDFITRLPTWLPGFLYSGRLNLGLDLQGGVHFVLGPDMNRVLEESLKREGQMAVQGLEKEGISGVASHFEKEGNEPMLRLTFAASADKTKADTYLDRNAPSLVIQREEDKVLVLKLFEQEAEALKTKTIEQSIQVLQGRINEFGVKEPQIYKAGNDRIVVQFPGITETERIKNIIQRTAKLEFRIVRNDLSRPALEALMAEATGAGIVFAEKSGQSILEYTHQLNAFLKNKIPTESVIRLEKVVNSRTQEISYAPILVADEVPLGGEHVQDTRVAINPETQLPEVALTFGPQGAQLFAEFTKANVKKLSAIILDDVIYSLPQIQQAIYGGSARITLGGFNYSTLFQEATDLVVVLRAGALPTTLSFLEERSVGPTLGSDSVRNGTLAASTGGALVILFMILYYHVSGLIASFALLLNGLMVLGVLTLLGATLTLPGIAGIALTFGMSVDANIIIFERIRENLRRGISVSRSVVSGYEKALITIFDANITTIFAGIILLQYGTGSIKGFAVTLILGIITSMFTAYFASKVLSEWFYHRPECRTMSIGISIPSSHKGT